MDFRPDRAGQLMPAGPPRVAGSPFPQSLPVNCFQMIIELSLEQLYERIWPTTVLRLAKEVRDFRYGFGEDMPAIQNPRPPQG